MEQLIAHLIGDYVFQSDWMAQEKVKSSWVALVHAISYSLPFLLITQSVEALTVIVLTHAVIDRFRLARYVCWAKNQLGPARYRSRWEDCQATGYHKDRPPWLSVWLLILADNTMHLCINYGAIRWLGNH